MDNTVRTDRLDEGIWNRYRTTIESLYWETSLDKIDAHMKTHHGFVASKSQYERHFRKWELRKNLTTAEWAVTIRYLTRNSIELKQLEVLFKGREIPQNRVLQEIARRSSRANTLHDGPHMLPRNITVRRRSRVPTIDTANGLQIRPAPAASFSTSSSSMQAESDFGSVTITSPSVHGLSPNKPTLIALHNLPFSWTHSINVESISQSLFSSQQLVKWTKPSKMRLDAIFHSRFQPIVDTTYGSHNAIIPLYAIASLVNSVSLGGRTTSNDAYALLKQLPLGDVSRSLKALPIPILDALKERVFATAVTVGDVDLVSTMLELNMNPREQIMMDWPYESKPTYPLQFAVAAGHFAVAKTLTSHMCRGATQPQLEEPMDHIFEGEKLRVCRLWKYSAGLYETERTELMCMFLSAGARPNRKCLGNDFYNVSVASLKQLLEAKMVGVAPWLEAGLLEQYFVRGKWFGDHGWRLAKKVLQFVSYDEEHHLPTRDPRLKTAILGALHVALEAHDGEALKIVLERFTLLGYRLDDGDAGTSDISASDFADRTVLEALENANWTLAANLMTAQKSKANLANADLCKKQCSELDDALAKRDLRLAYHSYSLIGDQNTQSGVAVLKLAISLHDSAMAITIIEDMEEDSQRGAMGVAALLEHGQTATVSSVLMRHPAWRSALDSASGPNDFGALEAMLFHGSAVPLITNPETEHVALTRDQLQLCFRIVAYHAMAKNDYKLCTWLLQVGMDPDGFHLLWNERDETNVDPYWNERIYVQKRPELHCSLPGGIGGLFDIEEYPDFTLPSLLAVAAEQSNIRWLRYLVTEDVSVVDSMALLRAIKSRATIATLRFLIDAAKASKSPAGRSYGIAALRQAIQYRDISRIDVLCGTVNVDEIEPFTEEFLHGKPAISPLGEAIIADDTEMVQLLLRRRASPNAYVSFDGLKMLEHIKSHIQRVTPLLAAIDVQSLLLVKVLVEHGAALQYTRNMGISRTPLQRAAETGTFDIVEYLVGQGAIIDTIPVYSGGTALQLAAMNGFCGIAAFLLEHEADPNYPPAKGDGRTAFEAAAEWGHVDTMSLLMQWNANLDTQFGEPPESQYERARRFAEKNGFMASKRFVEHLYGQRTRDESWHAGLALDSM